jgi:O-antigen/teichoic acid export membrane protein
LTGTALGHVIALALSVVVTRLYDPEMFATLEQFAMILGIFGVLAGGKYEAAIMLPEKEEEARHVLVLTIRIGLITGALMALAGWLFATPVSALLGNPGFAPYLWLTGPATSLFVVRTGINFWFSRQKRYRPAATSKLLFSAVSEPAKVGWGAVGVRPGGLVYGVVLGHFVSAAFLVWRYLCQVPVGFKAVNRTKLKELRLRYIDYPKYTLAGSLLNRSAQWLHIALFGWLFGTEGLIAVGFLGLARRMIMAPLNMLASSFSQVYYQRLTEIKDGAPLKHYYFSSLKRFALVALVMIVVIWLLPENTTAWIFGEEWYEVMDYLRIVVFWFAANFVVSALGFILHRIQKQRLMFYLDALHLIIVLIAVLAAWSFGADVRETLIAFVAAKVVFYMINLLVTLRSVSRT